MGAAVEMKSILFIYSFMRYSIEYFRLQNAASCFVSNVFCIAPPTAVATVMCT